MRTKGLPCQSDFLLLLEVNQKKNSTCFQNRDEEKWYSLFSSERKQQKKKKKKNTRYKIFSKKFEIREKMIFSIIFNRGRKALKLMVFRREKMKDWKMREERIIWKIFSVSKIFWKNYDWGGLEVRKNFQLKE